MALSLAWRLSALFFLLRSLRRQRTQASTSLLIFVPHLHRRSFVSLLLLSSISISFFLGLD
jgi:hypothetical protein